MGIELPGLELNSWLQVTKVERVTVREECQNAKKLADQTLKLASIKYLKYLSQVYILIGYNHVSSGVFV